MLKVLFDSDGAAIIKQSQFYAVILSEILGKYAICGRWSMTSTHVSWTSERND